MGADNVPATEHLAEHAAVLALRQAVVVATPRARLGDSAMRSFSSSAAT